MKKGEQPQLEPAKTLTRGVQRSQKAILRKVFPELLASLADGRAMRTELQRHGINWETFQRYVESRPDLRDQYQHARRICVEAYVAEIVPMSDAVIGEEMNVVTATRNAVDARKWVAGKLAPREYGDAPGGVTINQQTNVVVVSDDKLKQLQQLRQQMLNPSPPTHSPD
jgi:Bacteriophage Sf6, terminase small subunit-like